MRSKVLYIYEEEIILLSTLTLEWQGADNGLKNLAENILPILAC